MITKGDSMLNIRNRLHRVKMNLPNQADKVKRLNDVLYNSSSRYVEILEKLKNKNGIDRQEVAELFELNNQYTNVFKFFNFYYDRKLQNDEDIELMMSVFNLYGKINDLINDFIMMHKKESLDKIFKISPVALSGIMSMVSTVVLGKLLVRSNLPSSVMDTTNEENAMKSRSKKITRTNKSKVNS